MLELKLSHAFQFALAALASLMAAAAPAAAQWLPTRPITILVMAGPGGGADKAVRLMADILNRRRIVPVPVLVANMPGRTGAAAMFALKRFSGDSHTMMFTLNSFYTTPLRQPELGLDIEHFTPIARMGEDAFMLWVGAHLSGIETFKDFLASARSRGSTWVMAGTGEGAEDQILTEFLNATFGLKMTYRPMKGGGQVADALAEGLVDSTVNNPVEQEAYFRRGVTKPLVTFAQNRLKAYGRIPTLRETGTDFHYMMQRSLVGPPAMPRAALRYYQQRFRQLFNTPEWQVYREAASLSGEFITGKALMAYWLEGREVHKRWMATIERMKKHETAPGR